VSLIPVEGVSRKPRHRKNVYPFSIFYFDNYAPE